MKKEIFYPFTGSKKMFLCGLILLMALSVSEVMADIYFYTDKNGVRHFTNVPTPPEHKLFIRNSPITDKSNSGDSRLSKKANSAIASLRNFNDCLMKKRGCSKSCQKVFKETDKWLDSEEAQQNKPAAREIRAAFKDYEHYAFFAIKKQGGFFEIKEELWFEFINNYPKAINIVSPNLQQMINYVLTSARKHTDQAFEYMIAKAKKKAGKK